LRLTLSEITPASSASKSTGQKSTNCRISTSSPWWELPMVWLVTAQLCAAFSVQLPVFEMQAPIQKIRNGRCRKTPKGLLEAERNKALEVADI
jgi:hypothetical protein